MSGPRRRWRCWRSASRCSAGCPGKVLADRMGCLKGGVVANVVVPTRGVRAVRDALRVPAGLLRGRRPGIEGDRGEPGRLCQARPDGAAGTVRGPGRRERGRGGVVRRGQRRRPQRDLRGPGRAAGHRAGAAGAVAVAAGQHRAAGHPQGRPAVVRAVRLGPLLGARPADRHTGQAAHRRRAAAGHHDRHRRGRRRACPGRARRGVGPRRALRRPAARAAAGGAAEDRGGEGVLRARAGRRGVHHRRRRGRAHPAGPRAGRAEHAARRPRRRRVRSPRWTGRSRSAGGAPPTCAPSWPPGPATADPRPAGDALVARRCPSSRSGRWPTTPSAGCHDRGRRRRWPPT